MLPETGGASYFTLMVADRLDEVGPVTFDQLVDALYRQPGLPWAWITQSHQAQVAGRQLRAENKAAAPRSSVFDPALGWHLPGYDVKDPVTRRRALRFCVSRVVSNGKRGKQHRRWILEDPDGRIRRNPDEHPRVRSEGAYHDWSPTTRAAAEARSDAAVQVINEASHDRQVAQLTLPERAVLLRMLAAMLPADRSAAARMTRSALRRELEETAGTDPEEALRLLHRYSQTPSPERATADTDLEGGLSQEDDENRLGSADQERFPLT
jgi:hypothetical protein